jgi:hypothetical protein
MTDLAKLNRLRVNAGKSELKAWRATPERLEAAIAKLEADGYVDVVPGANLNATPVTEDPEVAKARSDTKVKAEEKSAKKSPAAKALNNADLSRQSRIALKIHEERDNGAKKERPFKGTKTVVPKVLKKPAEATEKSFPRGQVDPSKEPEKAARQQQHIADKRAAREANGVAPKAKPSDVITVADLCRKLNIDPKQGRAKLRRKEHAELLKSIHKGADKWTFPADCEKTLTSLLRK